MKRYCEISIHSSTQAANYLARQIELFAQKSSYWRCPSEESSLYEENIGYPSCCVVINNDLLQHAAIHFTQKSDRSLYLANIVPLSIGKLDVEQYNAIAEYFAKSFRKYARLTTLPLKISISKTEIKLDDIVTGKISKKLLKTYLAIHPLSQHQLDIDRLDLFICGLFRYSRTHFDLDAFQALLIEELGWSSTDAKWCRTRVETGLKILSVNKNF
jgi:hypothetical protein